MKKVNNIKELKLNNLIAIMDPYDLEYHAILKVDCIDGDDYHLINPLLGHEVIFDDLEFAIADNRVYVLETGKDK